MERKVALIDNSLWPDVYKPVDHWKKYLDVPWEAFRPQEGHIPDLSQGYTHLLLTGSEASILEREPWVKEEEKLIREALDRNLAILGSCWGHQLLALTLFGPGCVGRCARPEIGWISIRILEEDDLLGRPSIAFSFSSHFDEVISLGDSCRILASSDACAIQAFRLEKRPVWGLQIHPEITVDEGRELLKSLAVRNIPQRRLFEEAGASPARDSGLISKVVQAFLGQ